MAELKADKRMISDSGAPNLAGLTSSAQQLGEVAEAGFKTVAAMVKHKDALEESSMLAGAKTDLERLQIKYSNDPSIGVQGIENYKNEAMGTIEGYASKASGSYRSRLKKNLEGYANQQSNKVLAAGLKNTVKRERVQMSEDFEATMMLAGRASEAGNKEMADQFSDEANRILENYKNSGATSKDIIRMTKAYNVNSIASFYEGKLRRAGTQEQLDKVASEVLELGSDPVNIQAGNRAYSLYRKLTALRKDGKDLTVAKKNIYAKEQYKNLNLDKKSSNTLYGNALINGSLNDSDEEMPATTVDMVSADIQATGEDGNVTDEDIANGITSTLEAKEFAPMPLVDFARKTDYFLQVGSENTTEYKEELDTKIKSQVGEQVNVASIAVEKITRENPNLVNLDQQSKMIMSYFNVQKSNVGREDYQEITNEANELLKMGAQKYDEVKKLFNFKYGLSGTEPSKNLKRLYKNITGVNVDKTFSEEAYRDFYHMLEQNYISIGGHELSAADATKKDYARRHGSDRFSYTSEDLDALGSPLKIGKMMLGQATVSPTFPDGVAPALPSDSMQQTKNTPTVITGLPGVQLQNNLQETLVRFSQKNKHIKLPKHYGSVLDSSDTSKVKNNLAYPAPAGSIERYTSDSSLYITQDINGVMTEGRAFLKNVPLTTQNNLGLPVWEVWMQDYSGRVYPVRDDLSPSNNTLLFTPKSTAEFAPEYAKQMTEDMVNDTVNKYLAIQGREMYPYILTTSPKQNYFDRKAYQQDLKNQRDAEKVVRKGLGIPKPEEEGAE